MILMPMKHYMLTIDQGTSSTRALIIDQDANILACAQQSLTQYYPEQGWVEHDANQIWQDTLSVCRQAMAQANCQASDISCCGITNQRETVVLWDTSTGEPIHRAIVWQDRRTADLCQSWQDKQALVQQKTGLLIDPYFSATKIHWLLQHVPDAKRLAKAGQLACGTIDSFLLWRLTAGKVFATDVTNASRTLLFNLHTLQWDQELLALFDIPENSLPTVQASDAHFAEIEPSLFGHAIPITGILGDQQSALVGQACFQPGMVKATFGTGAFMLLNTGQTPITSQHRLLTTINYQLKGEVAYGLEGSIFNAGTTIKWLRDKLGVIDSTEQTEQLAQRFEQTHGVYLIPAFTGLGAPHWDPNVRGSIVGLTLETSVADLVRAALESVCYQTHDLLDCMQADFQQTIATLRVDGGMTANHWLLQFLADVTATTVQKPPVAESTALGAALAAGLGAGLYDDLGAIAQHWQCQAEFKSDMNEKLRQQKLAGWRRAITAACMN